MRNCFSDKIEYICRNFVGEVSEWLKEPVSKTGVPLTWDRGFESHPLRYEFWKCYKRNCRFSRNVSLEGIRPFPQNMNLNQSLYRTSILMRKIFAATLLGAILFSFSYGQNLKSDTTLALKISADTLSRKETDTISVRKDTTVLNDLNTNNRGAIRRDSASQATPITKSSSPELQAVPATASSVDPNGYKDAQWGMTPREVRKYLVDHDEVKGNDIQDVTNGFEYSGSLAGVNSIFDYQFDNDRLFIVRLTPKVKASSKFDFLDSFENYRTILETKYGKPVRSGFSKVDESYLNTIESIQLGFAKKYVLWKFDRSYIVLALVGRDRKLGIHISYVSRAIFDEMTSRIETLKLEDF